MSFGIVAQFTLHTVILLVLIILWLPIVYYVAYDSGAFNYASAQTLAIRDVLWNWSIIIPIGALAGNVVWFYRAMQRQETGSIEA